MKYYIADTSLFISRMKPPEICITTPSVVAEIKDASSSLFFEVSCSGNISIELPNEKLRNEIIEVARESGDLGELSATDIDLLAKAIEYKPLSIILTDDYRIQNIAKILNIPAQPINQKPITETYRWINVCAGCGRKVETGDICPRCGSPVRRKRERKVRS
ncbi:DNA-binding protein [Methanosarcinales archaeon]|nr:MAG: DNA-binding protein [Methanosarcinales archaeon]